MGLLILLLVVAGVIGYQLSLRPRRLPGGDWLVVDPNDGPVRGIRAALTLVAVTAGGASVTQFVLNNAQGEPRVLLIVVLAVVVWLFVAWHEGRKLREILVASAGELRVDDWPLASGEAIEVRYRRRLRSGRPAGGVRAALVQYATVRESHGGKTHTRKERLQVLELSNGEAQFRGKELEARWRFRVPGMPRSVTGAVMDLFFAVFSNHHHADEYWVLEVRLPLEGGVLLDSHFRLDVQVVPGRSQLGA